MFCAVIKRIIEETTQIGVHLWAGGDIENAVLLLKTDENHKPYIEYYKEMVIPNPEDFYFLQSMQSLLNIYIMTMDELIKLGLVTE